MINKKKIKIDKAEQAAVTKPPKRVSRKTLRRKRIIKRFIGLLLAAAVAAGAFFVAMKLLFVVRTVEISGSRLFTENEISAFLNIPEEENIFKIDAEEMEKSLTEEFTYLDSVQIIKRLPDRVEIVLEDSVETYYTSSEEKYTVYSQSFKMLRNATEPPVDAVWLDIEMDSEEKLSTVKRLLNLFAKYELAGITGISVSDEGMIGVICYDRIQIDFGTELDIDYKIKMCKKVLDEKIPQGEKGTIDATEGGEVVYKRQ